MDVEGAETILKHNLKRRVLEGGRNISMYAPKHCCDPLWRTTPLKALLSN